MAKVLYITAHPHDHQASFSLAVGKAFIDSYRESHPQDEVVHLDLYNLDIPHIDADVFSGWGKLRSGGDFSSLSAEEQKKVTRLGELVDQFVEADKYVFATPMWNFSYPPIMKAYIDAVCVAGKTFKYTAEGPVGLLPNKSAIHIQARGGVYSQGPAAEMECGHRHLTMIMRFFGITDFKGIFVEGMNAMPDQAPAIKEKAIEEAKKEAKVFGQALAAAKQ
ncbi:FMN-dependent NADH-azoreductase [Paenibacillus silvisoli]|uniref:FMN-dependent NADH-azoreductase n=1 Tax=Paenibacillus silvisoli TaxID=3110539 RepID=UPI0028051C21|nr:FMN-dependent NADH-azoreductase [Paenibacillus silvisoli]